MELVSFPLEYRGWFSCLSLPKGITGSMETVGEFSPLSTYLGLITTSEHWILKDILEETLFFSFLYSLPEVSAMLGICNNKMLENVETL